MKIIKRTTFVLFFVLLSQSLTAINTDDYSDMDINDLFKLLKINPGDLPGLDLYGMVPYRTPIKMLALPKEMSEEETEKFNTICSYLSVNTEFLESYKYILQFKIPSQEPTVKEFGTLTIYFQEIQYPYIMNEIEINDLIMLFYRLSMINTVNQEIILFGTDFWTSRK